MNKSKNTLISFSPIELSAKKRANVILGIMIGLK